MRRRLTGDDALARDYLRALDRALRGLPRPGRRDLHADIAAHIAEERRGGEDVAGILERLGDPAEIAAAERERLVVPQAGAGPGEWLTVALLLVGGIVVPVAGWFVGAAMLWASRAWTVRDKLVGTLVVPGGYATMAALLFVGFGGSSGSSACVTRVVHGHASTSCSGSSGGGSSALATALGVTAAIILLVAPLVAAVYLLRRARRTSSRPWRGGLVIAALLGGVLGVVVLAFAAQVAIVGPAVGEHRSHEGRCDARPRRPARHPS